MAIREIQQSIMDQIRPGNLLITKKSLKMHATTTEFMNSNSEAFDDFFIEEMTKAEGRYLPLIAVKKDEPLVFLKLKKHLWLYNNIDALVINKLYFLYGIKIVCVSMNDGGGTPMSEVDCAFALNAA